MNVVLFGCYLFISRYKRKQPKLNRKIMMTAILMFLFSTTHVSLGFQRLIEGFVVLRNQPGGPAAFFSDVSIPANVAKVCIHTINVSHLASAISILQDLLSLTSTSPSWVTVSWCVTIIIRSCSTKTIAQRSGGVIMYGVKAFGSARFRFL
jgi:hypothetical protein